MMKDTAGLTATALAARPEHNKLAVFMTDGRLGDHAETAKMLAAARQRGIAVFGLFLGLNPPTDRMDELYGSGQWVAFNELKEMPRLVGSRISQMMQRLR